MTDIIHRCLLVHELLVEVAQNLAADADKLHMAQACRAFYEVAMDELWRSPGNVLLKLISCFPPDAIHVVRGYYMGCDDIKILRPPTPSEWGRFKLYAKRVRVLGLFSAPLSIDGPARLMRWLDVLARAFPDTPVFPNLRQLHMGPDFVEYVHLFLQPNLTEFHLARYTTEAVQTVVPCLQRACAPTIRNLSFCQTGPISRIVREMDALTKAYEDFMKSCRSLVRLETSIPFRLSTLAKLAALPSLEQLIIHTPFLEELDDAEPMPEHIHLPALVSLDLHSTVEDILRYLRAASMPAIRNMALGTNWVNVPAFVSPAPGVPLVSTHELAEIISHLPKFPSLQRIHIFPPLAHPAALLRASTLTPLTSLPNLVIVDIYRFHFDLRPADVMAMARAWPALQCLCLGAYGQDAPPDPPKICVEDLYPFAQHCPALATLEMLVAGSSALARRTQPFAPEERVVHMRLKTFSVGPSLIRDVDDQLRAARFVRAVFPRAQLVAEDPKTAQNLWAALVHG
ncbi:hypothetical protein PsYK624_112250 [Phanerochaete sordida]|uniref:F-box domain-containing protein n=1 Tax=Phanerochaete sordida TaxID=48140 RepID=A0A9P3GHI8_9APHY|nr:hypothetical protein PsYK624_112250 [Phanerochaete sordida]